VIPAKNVKMTAFSTFSRKSAPAQIKNTLKTVSANRVENTAAPAQMPMIARHVILHSY
jgi:hypothetical protein